MYIFIYIFIYILAEPSFSTTAAGQLPDVRIKCQGPGNTVVQCRSLQFRGPKIKAVCDGAVVWVNENACLYETIPTPEQSAILHRGGTSATY